jgi:lysophospholipase L1-like esterase
MRRGITVFFANRPGSSPALMVFLLALAGLAGDSALVTTLRGFSVESEPHQTSRLGYYEGLINAPRFQVAESGPQPPPGWLPFGGDKTGIVRELPTYLRWEMKPNLAMRWNGTTFRTNSLGFRTPEVRLEKPPSTYRILVFGSSNTMGYGVNNDEVYTRLLERWLNEWIGPSRRVEVVNLAVAGDSPTRRLSRLQKEAGRWSADWLLCDASALDAWLEDTHIHSVIQRGIPIPYSFVNDAIRRTGLTAHDSLDSLRDKFRGENERLLSHVYAGWSAEAERLGIPLTVLILPRADGKGKSPRVFELIRSYSSQFGLNYLDLSGAFDHLDVDDFRISEWDKHPSAQGHVAIFEALRDAVRRQGELPGLSPSSVVADQGRRPSGRAL